VWLSGASCNCRCIWVHTQRSVHANQTKMHAKDARQTNKDRPSVWLECARSDAGHQCGWKQRCTPVKQRCTPKTHASRTKMRASRTKMRARQTKTHACHTKMRASRTKMRAIQTKMHTSQTKMCVCVRVCVCACVCDSICHQPAWAQVPSNPVITTDSSILLAS